MKKTDKEIKQEIDEIKKELLDDPAIDDLTKKMVMKFSEWSERFPKANDYLLKYVKNKNSNNSNK